ncbi:TPA: terminase [Salmonella enterica subsp. salamae serovar 16:m,t:e,n,x]|nr:terminase [Salmonella enterica subsp. salamae serovar 16:m,t:e,n,x]
MPLTPFQRHVEGIRARQVMTGQAAPRAAGLDDSSLYVQLLQLRQDVATLRDQHNNAERFQMKRDVMLPRWMPWAEKYLAAGDVYQNPVFVWCIVWLMDVRKFEKALKWASIAIEQGQESPEGFRNNLPGTVADEVLDWAETEFEAGRSVEPYFTETFKSVTEQWKLNEQLTAKYYKLAGFLILRGSDNRINPANLTDPAALRQADRYLEAAGVLYKNAGVKSLRERIAARLRKLETTPPRGAGAAEGEGEVSADRAVDAGQPATSENEGA